jgi:hypothetical protein
LHEDDDDRPPRPRAGEAPRRSYVINRPPAMTVEEWMAVHSPFQRQRAETADDTAA